MNGYIGRSHVRLLHSISAFVHPKLEKLVEEIKALEAVVSPEQEETQQADIADAEATAKVSEQKDVVNADVEATPAEEDVISEDREADGR